MSRQSRRNAIHFSTATRVSGLLMRRFSWLLAVVAATAALFPLLLLPASAGATSFGDWSPFIAPNSAWVGNCYVLVGPVFDSYASSYHKIGGVSVNCNSEHSIIKATVWQQYSAGGSSTVYNDGSSNTGTRYNSYGSGSGAGGILRSGAVCGHGWFRTVALVQTEQTGSYVYSTWQNTTGGCS